MGLEVSRVQISDNSQTDISLGSSNFGVIKFVQGKRVQRKPSAVIYNRHFEVNGRTEANPLDRNKMFELQCCDVLKLVEILLCPLQKVRVFTVNSNRFYMEAHISSISGHVRFKIVFSIDRWFAINP